MKTNLNSVILDGQTYLGYLYENTRLKHCEFDKFMVSFEKDLRQKYSPLLDMSERLSINIYPYLYTLSIISHIEYEAFGKFFKTYMRKADMIEEHEEGLNFPDLAASSPENFAAFVATMQYFFL